MVNVGGVDGKCGGCRCKSSFESLENRAFWGSIFPNILNILNIKDNNLCRFATDTDVYPLFTF